MQADMYVGASGKETCGYDNEPDNSPQGTGVKATKAEGKRWEAPGDKTMESDEHLMRGLTRETPSMPFVNPSGIGEGGAEDTMRIQSEGRGPMEGDYSVHRIGSSQAGELDPRRISGDGSRT